MITSDAFWRIVICGLIATFVMSMIAFLQGGIGLPVIDVGYLITSSFNEVHVNEPYDILWGNIAYYIIGVLLALIWVIFLQNRIPGNWFLQGLIYGTMVSVVAGLVVSPLVSLSAGDWFGIFYLDTWTPGLVILAGLLMHLAYGITLLLGLKYAGIKGIDAAQ
ncbi:MAG: hypothetical protein WD097_03120 [Balneolales bacterium]